MKKTFLAVAVLFASLTASAQFYVSAAGGYSLKVGERTLGTSTTLNGTTPSVETLKGSYGEGLHGQLRGGYFFNEKWGVELGVGYLNGSDQDVQSVSGIPNQPELDIYARGRAFGASLSAVYNITDNFYARAGYLTKIGGKTEAVGAIDVTLPVAVFNPAVTDPTLTADLDLDFTTDFKGKFPSGVIAAIGYKYPLSDKLNLFAEVEYMGINVTRDESNVGDFSATFGGNPVSREDLIASIEANPTLNAQFGSLLPLLKNDQKWGEGDLPSSKAPYSSFGINFGITYTFGGGKKATK